MKATALKKGRKRTELLLQKKEKELKINVDSSPIRLELCCRFFYKLLIILSCINSHKPDKVKMRPATLDMIDPLFLKRSHSFTSYKQILPCEWTLQVDARPDAYRTV